MCDVLFFIAPMIHRTNDPTSTTATVISMMKAIDYVPYLFTFNITSILSLMLGLNLFHETFPV